MVPYKEIEEKIYILHPNPKKWVREFKKEECTPIHDIK